MKKNAPAAPLDEEAFCLLMAQISLLVVAAAFLLCISWREKDNRKTKSRRKSRMHLEKSSESMKSSRSRKAETKGRVFKDNDNSLTERDKHLDQLFAETLDQDIERHVFSGGRSMNHNVFDRERERIQNAISTDFDECPNDSENDVPSSTRRMEQNSFRDLFNI